VSTSTANGVRRVNQKSIEAAKANARRFWTDPELIAKNLAGRKSKRFKETHTARHLQAEAIREKCTKAKRESEAVKAAQKKAGEFFRSAEIRALACQARRESPRAAEHLKTMRQAMERSEKCKKGIKHHAGRKWHIRSPSNVEYRFLNLAEFIRRNPHLFDPADVPVKAMRGIGMLRPSDTRKRISGTWKGWTWISLCEVFNNSGNDLLHRVADSSHRPLFIALRTEHFLRFRIGTKNTEYRPYGPRWNGRTCAKGRPVVLSRGYGKADRLTGKITGFYVREECPEPEAWRSVYGDRPGPVACIQIGEIDDDK
jgi:hypothetical protein